MKTSNVILILIAALCLGGVTAANLNIRRKVQSGEYKDRFYGHAPVNIDGRPRYVFIDGPYNFRFSVEKSDSNQVQIPSGVKGHIQVESKGDSLYVYYPRDSQFQYSKYPVTLLLPAAQQIHLAGGETTIWQFEAESLHIELKDQGRGKLFNSKIDRLGIGAGDDSEFTLDGSSELSLLELSLGGTARLALYNLPFDSLRPRIGPNARLELSGKSLDSFIQNHRLANQNLNDE